MAKTGTVVVIEPNAMSAQHPQLRQCSRRLRLLCGLSAIAFVASVALPITIDTVSIAPAYKSALAADFGNGNGNGNGDGQGRGKGNGKGQGDENGGRKPPKDGGDGHGDHDDDDEGHDDDGTAADRDYDAGDNDRGDFGADDETAYADAVTTVDGLAANNPVGTPATALPTVQQIFALGEGSVLDTDQELLAIQNGWNTQN